MNENQQLSVHNTAFDQFNSDLMKMIISPFLLPVDGLPPFYTEYTENILQEQFACSNLYKLKNTFLQHLYNR